MREGKAPGSEMQSSRVWKIQNADRGHAASEARKFPAEGRGVSPGWAARPPSLRGLLTTPLGVTRTSETWRLGGGVCSG
jgi:hypothetical protein